MSSPTANQRLCEGQAASAGRADPCGEAAHLIQRSDQRLREGQAAGAGLAAFRADSAA